MGKGIPIRNICFTPRRIAHHYFDAAYLSEFNCILDEVEKNLAEPVVVALDHKGELVLEVDEEVEVLQAHLVFVGFDHLDYDTADVERGIINLEGSLLCQ